MSIPFRVGRYVDPSGFALAVVDVPALDPEKNISLIDYSHKWEENIASSDSSVIQSYVDNGGHMPPMTVTEFVVTNISTTATNDIVTAPLYYRHQCRFYNYTYGQSPGKQVYITDQYENILKDVNYTVRATRVMENVYKIDVLTDFFSNQYTQYKVKYNRCTSSGGDIYPGWVENLNAAPYFVQGTPSYNNNEYSIEGPDRYGMWTIVVPPVPTLSGIVNSVGVSFENCPTIVEQNVRNNVSEYAVGVIVKYTLKATGPSTFTIQRSHDRYGVISNLYLQSATSDSWGASPVNFNIGTDITAIYGTTLHVHGDNYLNTNDESYFTAKRSYYYLMPTSYSAIYLIKPKHVTPIDDWYISVRNGRFRRRMDSSGVVVPSGQGTLFEYGIPEWGAQLWDLTYGPPYKKSINERVELLDKNTIQLQQTPLFVDASSVLYNPLYPGFLPSGYIDVKVNDKDVPATGVLDWDVYNGTVKLAQVLSQRDDITATYIYGSDFYEYKGYEVSDTTLLCLFDASGVQDFYNAEIGGRVTFVGSATTDTVDKYSGYASLYLNGASYVTLPDSDGNKFGTGDFTIEVAVRLKVNQAFGIMNQYVSPGNQWKIRYNGATIQFAANGMDWFNIACTPSVNTWYVLAISRHGNTIYLLQNGTILGSADVTGLSFPDVDSVITIGYDIGSPAYLNGWIDDIRITKGRGLYTSTYTPSPSGDLPSVEALTTEFVSLDLNPTPDHSYGMYASGTIAHIFLQPYINVDTFTTIKNTTLYHNLTGTPSSPYDFELGTVSLGPNCKITDINVTDVRVRGGGLSKLAISNLEEVEKVQPETEFYWDVGYFDGQAVPANGVLVVRIPKTVLTSNGGAFELDEVRQKVLKHMALGEYPILEFV